MAFILKKQKQRKVALLLCASNNSEVENNDHCSFSLLTNSNKVKNSLKRKKKKQFVGRTTQYDSVFPFFFYSVKWSLVPRNGVRRLSASLSRQESVTPRGKNCVDGAIPAISSSLLSKSLLFFFAFVRRVPH